MWQIKSIKSISWRFLLTAQIFHFSPHRWKLGATAGLSSAEDSPRKLQHCNMAMSSLAWEGAGWHQMWWLNSLKSMRFVSLPGSLSQCFLFGHQHIGCKGIPPSLNSSQLAPSSALQPVGLGEKGPWVAAPTPQKAQELIEKANLSAELPEKIVHLHLRLLGFNLRS